MYVYIYIYMHMYIGLAGSYTTLFGPQIRSYMIICEYLYIYIRYIYESIAI